MALGPAEVHPEQHLGPIGGLGATRPGADRDHRVLRVVVAREQEQRPLAPELAVERVCLALDVRLGIGVGGLDEQVDQLDQIRCALLQGSPQGDLLAQTLGLAQDLLRRPLVVPEPGFAGSPVELGQVLALGGEVKDAPRSTRSARPGREWTQRPLGAHLEILEQDRTKLDQPQGRLAPCDDGVHAGTVAVVGADSTVAITVEGGGVAAGSAIPFARDQIHELGFLSLLHGSLSLALRVSVGRTVRDAGASRTWLATSRGAATPGPWRRRTAAEYRRAIHARQGGSSVSRRICWKVAGRRDEFDPPVASGLLDRGSLTGEEVDRQRPQLVGRRRQRSWDVTPQR